MFVCYLEKKRGEGKFPEFNNSIKNSHQLYQGADEDSGCLTKQDGIDAEMIGVECMPNFTLCT